MPSFDVVCETDIQELRNAVDQARKEISTRYDFKGSRASLELDSDGGGITAIGDDDSKLKTVLEILRAKMARRNIDTKCLDYGKVEHASGGLRRRRIEIKQGIDRESAKKIVGTVKREKWKIQIAIQGDRIRVSGKKRDTLQEAIRLIGNLDLDRPVKFTNFRD